MKTEHGRSLLIDNTFSFLLLLFVVVIDFLLLPLVAEHFQCLVSSNCNSIIESPQIHCAGVLKLAYFVYMSNA